METSRELTFLLHPAAIRWYSSVFYFLRNSVRTSTSTQTCAVELNSVSMLRKEN
jgi:hypothetical protein